MTSLIPTGPVSRTGKSATGSVARPFTPAERAVCREALRVAGVPVRADDEGAARAGTTSEVEPLPEPRFDVAAVFVLIVLAAVALGALVGVHLL